MVQVGLLPQSLSQASLKVLPEPGVASEAQLGKDPFPSACGRWWYLVPCGLSG